jgi:mannosyltransferase OCH1-like enzyme
VIPKTIHQIWLGGLENRPDRIVAAMARVEQAFDDYTYRVWTDADFASLDIQRYASIRPYAALSDLMRYRTLLLHGGWYVDADCEPIGTSPRMPIGGRVFVVSGVHPKRCWNGMIGSEPNHVLMRDAYRRSATVFDKVLDGGSVGNNVINLTGPGLLFRLCRKHKIAIRRWNRWMAHIHPAAPLLHRSLHSWSGQAIHVETDA